MVRDSKPAEKRMYKRGDCVVFYKTKDAFGGLSNMASGYPLIVNGIHIPTTEALYQACRFPHRPEIQRLILAERSPMAAKMRSKHYRSESRPDWNAVRKQVMRWCLRVKLVQHRDKFGSLLSSTMNAPIVEQSRRDSFWGAIPVDEDTLEGFNVLGRFLMELREQYLLKSTDFCSVCPPNIENFLLYDEPIGVVEPVDQMRLNTLFDYTA